MEKKMIAKTLKSGQVAYGICSSIQDLSCKYQVWAKTKGLTAKESLACFIAGNYEGLKTYYGDYTFNEVEEIIKTGFAKFEGQIPDLSDY